MAFKFNFETVVQFILLVIALRLLHAVTANDSCSEVRRNFVAKRIGNMRLVPYSAFEAKDLQVCSNSGLTCCTRTMESRFQSAASRDVEEVLKYKTSSLKYNFRSFSEKFQDDVEELIYNSKNSTRDLLRHSLRKRTNAQAMRFVLAEVDRLFADLKLQSQPEEVKNSFKKFADKLFVVTLDGAYNVTHPDLPYEKCVERQRTDLHPFMDVPTITAANLSSALQLAQTFHEALEAGAGAVNVTEGADLTKSCQRSLMRMQYCSHCFGLTLLKPCMGLCRNVLRGCFAGITEMDQYWNFYVSALIDVTKRMRSLESKYNLEIAFEDFKTKFSSSFSVMLENITTLQNTVEKRCRKSRTLKRSKRSTDFPQPDSDDVREGGKSGGKHRNRQGKKSSGPKMRSQRKRTRVLLKLKEEKMLPGKTMFPPQRTRVRPPHEVLFNPPQKRPRKATPQQVVEVRSTGNLHSRIRRFVISLNLSINFYRHLPDDMCDPRSGMTLEVVNHGKCWDGSDIVEEYPNDVVPIGFEKQASNPEVKVLKVEKEVIRAIEKLRNSAKILLLAGGKTEVPRILQHAPVYKKRKGKEEDRQEERMQTRPEWPCDDEDDCAETGSGEDPEIELYPAKDETRRRGRKNNLRPPLIPYEPSIRSEEDIERIKLLLNDQNKPNLYNDTDITDVIKLDEKELYVSIENAKNNRKGRKNQKNEKGKTRKKKPDSRPKPTEKTVESTTTGASVTTRGSSLLNLTSLAILTQIFLKILALN